MAIRPPLPTLRAAFKSAALLGLGLGGGGGGGGACAALFLALVLVCAIVGEPLEPPYVPWLVLLVALGRGGGAAVL